MLSDVLRLFHTNFCVVYNHTHTHTHTRARTDGLTHTPRIIFIPSQDRGSTVLKVDISHCVIVQDGSTGVMCVKVP